jgi:hypothetical protein
LGFTDFCSRAKASNKVQQAIMVAFRLIGCVFTGFIAATCASPQPNTNSPRSAPALCARAATDTQITTFVQSLAIPTAQASAITKVLGADTNLAAFLQGKTWDAQKLTQTACAALKLVLGDSKVDTKPVDSALVDENW